jgi:hypothetical protein
MAPSPHESDAAQARLVLGLSGAATEAELQAAYWALRAHVEARAVASEDPGFVAARTAELQRLTESLAIALDVPPDSLPPPQLDWVKPPPRRRLPVGAGVVAFALAVVAGLVFWMWRAPGDDSDGSPLAAVAHTEPPGRLVFRPPASRRPEAADERAPTESGSDSRSAQASVGAPAATVSEKDDASPESSDSETPESAPASEATGGTGSGRTGLDAAFAASPARYTVLDAEGTEVVRAGVVSSAPVELPPGEYAVWLSALGCDASRQHTIRVESDTDVELAAPQCTHSLEVVVRSDVTGDLLRIDGEAVGGTGPDPHRLGPGEHEITIEHDGETAWSARVAVDQDDRLTLHAKLAEARSRDAATRAAAAPRERPAARAETAAAGSKPRAEQEIGGAGAPDDPGGGIPRARNTGGELARDGRAGSRSWHDGVRRLLIDKYDENRSGSLDTTIEIASIPCAEWRAIESQYETGGLQVPMSRLYGFDGSEWVEGALGIERGLRDFTYRRMKECGLK